MRQMTKQEWNADYFTPQKFIGGYLKFGSYFDFMGHSIFIPGREHSFL